ncbi:MULTISPECIES: undecaprenyldiphospho-muramoylpentapeptide beta-N-acetylglucosaminyltransferase [Legionella]|uniref:undecaprenyldiphospho-muramoylpentapeptide beta-N-acetylglucosaminyltransferase n=1 Tax=Legionella TaxID=445 RepID=UPI000F8C7842|nr:MULTISPECIES: undecaprenyldiphospho-muramoylpentapeptide beta-N-acetylglucosaminyltransferase [Legionella]MCP0912933.1 undecaprenyldiphospho-muramoylpentapeptide beta-N-acetylglucosaminyltransferase [Legionella sp. 27cVA30]RUQ96775.1 undecaprenyldiphospho-muramoylpentapeptide beta-N-acetylglucosaminyltransferase [Legionella septentrionalis]RUR10155.1 undecaprenyldiphospho-muramoylpentapeptide beta-N-acetylglucosaminyltransferase [Legionella septentrionalis]RUR15513.1 undecaprenyldiphospho-mu
MNPKIVLTGGGTAGHVTPNMALIDELQKEGWGIAYIGSAQGVEKNMIAPMQIPFYGISSGKLRRYFSWQNFFDPVKILLGIVQSFYLLRKLKADIVFSKGGFVAFPVVVGAWLNRIPVIAHESDLTPGLANRLSFPFVDKICLTFAAAKQHFKKQEKVEVTGTPIRRSLFQGDKEKGLQRCGFNDQKPCLLVIGGSQGANKVNQCVRLSLASLCTRFQVIHVCGPGKVDASLKDREGYYQIEYAKEELADLFAASQIVISRAGANSLYELLALGKPHILIPLPQQSSRGDQIQNARYFEKLGISKVIEDEKLSPETLFTTLQEMDEQSESQIEKIKALGIQSSSIKIISLIKEIVHVKSARIA